MVGGSYDSLPNLAAFLLTGIRQLEPCLCGDRYLQGLQKAIVNYLP